MGTNNMTAKERIAIIGAGIGGLSAAIRLQGTKLKSLRKNRYRAVR